MESLQPKGSNPFLSGLLGSTKPEVAKKIIGQLTNAQATEKAGTIKNVFANVLGTGAAPDGKKVKELESKIRQLGTEKSNLVKYNTEERRSRANTGGENPVSRGYRMQAQEASEHIAQLESEIQKLSESASFKTVFLKEEINGELGTAGSEVDNLSREIGRVNEDVKELKKISKATGAELDGQIQNICGRTRDKFNQAQEYVSKQKEVLAGTEFMALVEDIEKKVVQAAAIVNTWKA